MKRTERILIKLIIMQFIFLLLSQALLTQETAARYLSKVVYYEGVTKGVLTNILETSK
jgi:hypothetical protein